NHLWDFYFFLNQKPLKILKKKIFFSWFLLYNFVNK
ncbi:unnamed protein product, partial [Staurois parvus]